jgi:hypothetical protein
MKQCTHPNDCEECHRHRVTALRMNTVSRRLAEKLGVTHLTGERQIEAALARVEQLILIEEIAALAERDGLMAASADAASPALRA